MKYKYVFEDFTGEDKSCIVSTMTQLSELSGIEYGSIKYEFSKGNTYMDKNRKFQIRKLPFIKSESLSREGRL